MALSYFTESEAPRDFRISSTESESHYTKCILCYTIKKNFYCVECIKTGNFVHSSMPYSDRFVEKQAKLLRLKANRKHVQDRCEKLLQTKNKWDSLQTDVKLCKDKVDLIKLAIEERKNNIEEKKKELIALKQYNTELSLKLPRYQKRVSSLCKHAQVQQNELDNKISVYNENARMLAALRRARIRQLNKYIFPVFITYDTSESLEDMEFLQVDSCPEPAAPRERLHVGEAWLPLDEDFSRLQTWVSGRRGEGAVGEAACGAHRAGAALQAAAQLTTLLAWTLDCRLPAPLPLSECAGGVGGAAAAGGGQCAGSARGTWRRVCAGAAALAARGGASLEGGSPAGGGALHRLAQAAAIDEPNLGRVEGWVSEEVAAQLEACPAPPSDPEPEPEHWHWPDTEMEELPTSAAPAASLVTSAAASLASMWRGWTK